MNGLILGLLGNAGCGKDTVANMICSHTGATLIALANPLKEICRTVFDFSHEQLCGPSEKRNAPDPRYTRADGKQLTTRYALQKLGTEWGRDCYPDVWIDLGIRNAKKLFLQPVPAPLVVITDVRFINEAEVGKHLV